MKGMNKEKIKNALQVLVYANMCTMAMFIASNAAGFCIPGFAYEPEMSIDLLSEDAE